MTCGVFRMLLIIGLDLIVGNGLRLTTQVDGLLLVGMWNPRFDRMFRTWINGGRLFGSWRLSDRIGCRVRIG